MTGLRRVPTYFRGGPTDKNGEARLRWKCSVRRCMFPIECCTDIVAGNWELVGTAIHHADVVDGLKSGGKYWFRICAQNSHGKSPLTQPVAVRVK